MLVIGLDNSGKTTLCASIKGDLDPITVPTVGFSTPIRKTLFQHDVVFYDLGGGARIRGVWPSYFADVHGVVFVVDAADAGRVPEASEELKQALLHPMVVGKPLLVLANKQDLPPALSEVELAQGMGLDKLASLCRHHISGCIAKASLNGGTIDARIFDGLQWLIGAIATDYEPLNARRTKEMAEFAAADAERRRKQAEAFVKRQEEKAAAAKAAAAAAASGVGAVASGASTGSTEPSVQSPAAVPAAEPSAVSVDSAAAAAGAAASTAPHATPTEGASVASPAAETSASASTSAAAAASAGVTIVAPAKQQPVFKPAAPTCSVCKEAPAVRRCAAAAWNPVCAQCGDKLDAAEAAKKAVAVVQTQVPAPSAE